MKKRLLVLCMIFGVLCAGCGNTDVSEDSGIQIEEVTGEDSVNKDSADEDAENSEVSEQDSQEDLNEETEAFDLFSEIENREFYFSSGAGGWRTILHIDKDGSFSGEFSDSDMGSIGEGYPNGTYYVCGFQGEFTKPVKVNEYTYSVGIAGISYTKEPGTEEIIDGILHCYSEPYGIEGTNSLLFYLPGAPLEELPQEYLDWVRYEVSEVTDGKLPFYGVYNEKEQNGFSSYEMLDPIDELMRTTEEAASVLKEALEQEPLTQTEMNRKSNELYQTWDKTLNTLWAELKNTLSEKEFQTLLEEQRQWVKDKEKAVNEAGADVAGGSMEALVRNMEGADITEKRVYELYELLQ